MRITDLRGLPGSKVADSLQLPGGNFNAKVSRMATRAERAENYHAKKKAGFVCGGCGKGPRTLACDSMDGLVVLCPTCVTDDVKVRPGQWQEVEEQLRERQKKEGKK